MLIENETLQEIVNQAQHKCTCGKCACEAKKELQIEYPFISKKLIAQAIKLVRSEYDFPTKRELGLY